MTVISSGLRLKRSFRCSERSRIISSQAKSITLIKTWLSGSIMQLTRLDSVPSLTLITLCSTLSILPCNGGHLSQRGGWMNFLRLEWSASENLQSEKVCTLKGSVIQRVQKDRPLALIQAWTQRLRSSNQLQMFSLTLRNRNLTYSHFSSKLADQMLSRLSLQRLWGTWIFSRLCLRSTSRS